MQAIQQSQSIIKLLLVSGTASKGSGDIIHYLQHRAGLAQER
jgi:hypothetical protein